MWNPVDPLLEFMPESEDQMLTSESRSRWQSGGRISGRESRNHQEAVECISKCVVQNCDISLLLTSHQLVRTSST